MDAEGFDQQKHPEIRSDEVWITNADFRSFSKVGWSTKRKGKVALDSRGRPVSESGWENAFPVFAKKSELAQAGIAV